MLTSDRSSNSRAADSALIGAGVVASGVLVAQLFTPADPIGKCLRFWRQLGAQVRRVEDGNSEESFREFGASATAKIS